MCDDNQILSLAPISACTNLRVLDSLSVCVDLKEICCEDSLITSLNPLIYLRHLKTLLVRNNPLGLSSIQVQRF